MTVLRGFVESAEHVGTQVTASKPIARGYTSIGVDARRLDHRRPFGGVARGTDDCASGHPGFEARVWQGFVAPAATPPEITTKLRNAYLAGIRDEDITKKLTAGIDLQSTAAEFADYAAGGPAVRHRPTCVRGAALPPRGPATMKNVGRVGSAQWSSA
jgi:hypothetical protein